MTDTDAKEVAAWGDDVGRSEGEWCAVLLAFRVFTGFPRELDAIVAQFANKRRKSSLNNT